MIKIDLMCGTFIGDAIKQLKAEAKKTNDVCYAIFNGTKIYSTDSEDEAFEKVTGMTKNEHEEYECKKREEYERKEKEYKAKIPQLTEEYRQKARGLVLENELDFWDKMVPIRLNDLYHGWELDQVLTACKYMRDESMSYNERLHKAYDFFMESGHSGMSAGLTASMYRRFVPNGEDLADAVMNFRFENKNK